MYQRTGLAARIFNNVLRIVPKERKRRERKRQRERETEEEKMIVISVEWVKKKEKGAHPMNVPKKERQNHHSRFVRTSVSNQTDTMLQA